MRRLPSILTAAFVAGCAPAAPATVQDGEAFLAAHVSPAASMDQTQTSLERVGATVARVDATACGGLYLGEPKFRCSGGPALFVTLNQGVQPSHPVYSPTLNAFLAYDSAGRLEHSAVAKLGGDR